MLTHVQTVPGDVVLLHDCAVHHLHHPVLSGLCLPGHQWEPREDGCCQCEWDNGYLYLLMKGLSIFYFRLLLIFISLSLLLWNPLLSLNLLLWNVHKGYICWQWMRASSDDQLCTISWTNSWKKGCLRWSILLHTVYFSLSVCTKDTPFNPENSQN